MKGNNMVYNIEDMIVDKDNNIKTPEDKLIGYFHHIDEDLYVVYYNDEIDEEDFLTSDEYYADDLEEATEIAVECATNSYIENEVEKEHKQKSKYL
jgi:hypothetical protein